MEEDIECFKCGSEDVIKKGFRDTKLKGRIQRYLCLDCGNSFSIDHQYGFKFNIHWDTVDQIYELKQKGLSLRKIAKRIGSISHQTVSNVISKMEDYYC